MRDTQSNFLDPEYVLLSMKVTRRLVYKKLTHCMAVFEYHDKWRKLKAEAICEHASIELSLFLLCLEIKEELDKCCVLTEEEETISTSTKVWYNRLVEGT